MILRCGAYIQEEPHLLVFSVIFFYCKIIKVFHSKIMNTQLMQTFTIKESYVNICIMLATIIIKGEVLNLK